MGVISLFFLVCFLLNAINIFHGAISCASAVPEKGWRDESAF